MSDEPQRYIVSASLLTCSPLAIQCGNGTEERRALGQLGSEPFRMAPDTCNATDKRELTLQECDQLIIRDWQGRPYIPGSSLKGVIREFLLRDGFSDREQTAAEWLLGTGPSSGFDVESSMAAQGRGGAATFEDAFLDAEGRCAMGLDQDLARVHGKWFRWLHNTKPEKGPPNRVAEYAQSVTLSADSFAGGSWRLEHERLALLTDTQHLPFWDPNDLSYVEHQIGIDRRTGAVASGKLFTCEAVPAGIPFHVQMVVDHGRRALEATALLLKALAAFNLDPVYAPIQLGSGSNHGWGRMACLFPSVRVEAWTPSNRRVIAAEELDVRTLLTSALDDPPRPRKTCVQIDIELLFEGPFLVNDPSKACVIRAVDQQIVQSGKQGEKGLPDHVPRVASARVVPEILSPEPRERRPGELWCTPFLPATGFKGALRSQMERILRTIHRGIPVSPHGELQSITDEAPRFIRELLGFEDHASGLWCSEFFSHAECELSCGMREMVAIDRFTGGASNHAKFDALTFDRPRLRGALVVNLPRDEADARKAIGAVALVLRDLMEGDVVFGFGDTKALGQCRGQILTVTIAHRESCPLAEVLAGMSEGEGSVRLIDCSNLPQGRIDDVDAFLNNSLCALRATTSE